MKRLMSLLFALLLLISVIPVPASATEVIAGGLHIHGPVAWQITSDGTLTITGNRSVQAADTYDWDSYSDIVTSIVISDGITTIPQGAFNNFANVTEVYIGNAVQVIGFSAFSSCTALESIAIPSSVTEIHGSAFNGCSNLKVIEFAPDSNLISIGRGAFISTGITELSIPASVRIIDQSAFADCANLTTLNLPEGLETIGQYAFRNCTSLTGHLYIPSTLTQIGWGAFEGVNKWTSVELNASHFAHLSFNDNPYLQSVVIDGNVRSLDNDLFQNCTGLTSVTFNAPVEEIGHSTFEGCTALTSIELPQSLIMIGTDAFKNSGLTEITIPDSVTDLGMRTFSECEALTSVTIGSGLVRTENFAFADCTNLKQVDLGSIRSISGSAFENCSSLARIVIPDTVRSIMSGAFTDCTSLHEVVFMGDAPSFDSNKDSFANVTADVHYFPDKEGWTSDVMLDYAGDLTWIAHEHTYDVVTTPPTCTEQGYTTHTCTSCGKRYEDAFVAALGHTWDDETAIIKNCTVCGATSGYRINLDPEVVGDASSAWVDGMAYPLLRDNSSYYVALEQTDATNLVIYTYNDPNAEDVHTQYPTGMKVWMLKFENDAYTATYVPEFDDLLQYSGSSIRIKGVKGIRMITSVPRSAKQALTGKGLAGYTLVEYGTALAWASDLEGGNSLVLGQSYTKSNYAYKKGVADPVFKNTGTLIQYTNVLVGFSDDQCIPDIAMRPYIIVEDAEGNQITIYGGMLYRSIGYIAYQNRNAFKSGTDAYEYVWNIIHHVYGDQFDADYKG